MASDSLVEAMIVTTPKGKNLDLTVEENRKETVTEAPLKYEVREGFLEEVVPPFS